MIFFLKDLIQKDQRIISPGIDKNIEYIAATLQHMYTIPQRYYHTWKHVEECLKELEMVPNLEPLQKQTLKIALYYHDCVDRSELFSAQTAHIHLRSLGFSGVLLEDVFELIMLTQHNKYAMNYMGQIMVDIDLAILGKDSEIFDRYEENIRKEYSQFSNSEYNEGRSKILKNFLYRTYIYHSEYFHDRYEEKARDNISNLLKKLENSF